MVKCFFLFFFGGGGSGAVGVRFLQSWLRFGFKVGSSVSGGLGLV